MEKGANTMEKGANTIATVGVAQRSNASVAQRSNASVSTTYEPSNNPPISSYDLHKLADWIASKYDSKVKQTKEAPQQQNKNPTVKTTDEYNSNKIYALGDLVSFMGREWIVTNAAGQPGYKPPTEPNVTFNNTWKLVYRGGRRKTVRRGKKHSRRR